MADTWILAIDQGTTNTKALLIDRMGLVVFRAIAPVRLLQPKPGYIEQSPHELWDSVCQVISECLHYTNARSARIEGIAITNQRETAVMWQRHRESTQGDIEALGNAISWQCRRSEPQCDRLRCAAAEIQTITGLPLDPLLSATKWAWAFDSEPFLRGLADDGNLLLGTVDSWLLYRLTEGRVHATDHTNASRTGLLSLASQDWDDSLLRIFGIPRTSLPTVFHSSDSYATCSAIPGLEDVPIVAVIGDSHAALMGHGSYAMGTVKATYGTGSSLMMLTPILPADTNVVARSVAWSTRAGTQFALEGNIAMSGAAVQWVGEFLGLPQPASDAATLADTVPDAGGLILVPAMVGLGAPHWDSTARGVIANLGRSHTAAHLARAALDAIAFQVADVLSAMESAAELTLPVLLADGGATRNSLLMQIQADLIGRPVNRATIEDLSARGAALLGGLELGWWESFEELTQLPGEVDTFVPKMQKAQRKEMRSAWELAVRRTRLRAGSN